MLIEVFILGGFVAILSSALANLGERRALARTLHEAFDSFLQTVDLAMQSLENKNFKQYKDCRKYLLEIERDIRKQYTTYHKVLVKIAPDLKDFRDELSALRREFHVQNSANQSQEQFEEIILKRMGEKYPRNDAFSKLNNSYNATINKLWGWLTFHVAFPRKLKSFGTLSARIDANIQRKRIDPSDKLSFDSQILERARIEVGEFIAMQDIEEHPGVKMREG